jgi:hypothetical protein
MTELLRALVSAVAILATVLTAGAVGAARGQAMAAGEIVICSGGAAVTIRVDSDGNPTGPAHWCPDCVITLLAGVSAPPGLPSPPTTLTAAPGVPPVASHSGRGVPAPCARGPPLV